MRIQSIDHKGLRRLVEDNDGREIRPDLLNRVRRVLTVLIAAQGMNGVVGPPGGIYTSLLAIVPEYGVFRFPVIGELRLPLMMEKSVI